MRILEFKIPKEYDGCTVKHFMRNSLNLSARVLIKQKNSSNGISVNGEHIRTIDRVKEGDILTLEINENVPEYIQQDLDIAILYEDEDFIVPNKPYDLPVHPSTINRKDTLLNAVAYVSAQKGEKYPFRPIYRLDRNTTGAVVVAKHKIASAAKVEKEYFAVCEGVLKGKGTIDKPICKEEGSSIKRAIGGDINAVTEWEAISDDGNHTLLKLILKTGRTHQIRVHFASISHPLAGDDLYGGSNDIMERQALHCKNISIMSDVLKADIQIKSDFPEDFIIAFPNLF